MQIRHGYWYVAGLAVGALLLWGGVNGAKWYQQSQTPEKLGVVTNSPYWNSSEPEAKFMYTGAYILPSCVQAIGASINLRDCTTSGATSTVTIDKDNWVSVPSDHEAAGSAKYRVIADNEGIFALDLVQFVDANAQHESIQFVKKTDDTLTTLDSIPGGDGCDGGFTIDYAVRNGLFRYTSYLTPFTVVTLATTTTLRPGVDLQRDHESCAAKVTFVYDLPHRTKTIESARLTDQLNDHPGETEKFAYQSCYNRVNNSFLIGRTNKLSEKDLQDFVSLFYAQCVK